MAEPPPPAASKEPPRPPVPDIAKRLAEAVAGIAESVVGGRKIPVSPVRAWTEQPGAKERRLTWAQGVAGALHDDARTDRDVGLLACALVGLAYVDGCVEERSDHMLREVVSDAVRALRARQRCPADLEAMANAVQLRAPHLADRDIRELREIAAWVRGEGTGSTLDRDLALVPKSSRDAIRQEILAAARAPDGNMGMMANAVSNYLTALNNGGILMPTGSLNLDSAPLLDPRNGAAQAIAQALPQDKIRLPRSAAEWDALVEQVMAPWRGFGAVPHERVFETAAEILGLQGASDADAPQRSTRLSPSAAPKPPPTMAGAGASQPAGPPAALSKASAKASELSEKAEIAQRLIEGKYRPNRRVPTKVFTMDRNATQFGDWPSWSPKTVTSVYAELVSAGYLRREGRSYVRTSLAQPSPGK